MPLTLLRKALLLAPLCSGFPLFAATSPYLPGGLEYQVPNTESVWIPGQLNKTYACSGYLVALSRASLEKAPGESHEDAAKFILQNFKTGELRNYSRSTDLRLKTLIAQAGEDKAYPQVAARIEGLLADSRPARKSFVVLEGKERITEFVQTIIAVHETVRVSRKGFFNSFSRGVGWLNLFGLLMHPAGILPSEISLMENLTTFIALSFASLPVQHHFLRKSSRPSQALIEALKFEKTWRYSSLHLDAAKSLLKPDEGRSYKEDDLSNFTDVTYMAALAPFWMPFAALGVVLSGSANFAKDLLTFNRFTRTHLMLDHLYFWDEETDQPVLVLGMRIYDKKPQTPKMQKEKQTENETSWAASAQGAEGP
jgi:hypothetical protein